MMWSQVFGRLLATAVPPPAGAPAAGEIPSLWSFIEKGGILMIPIGLCSIVVIAVVVERLLTLRRASIIPAKFVADLTGALERGDLEAARGTCDGDKSPIAQIAAAGLRRIGRNDEEIEKHVTEAGLWEVRRLRKNVRVLQVVGAIAPLLGLLGTIFGMIQAFQTVATSADALGRTELLAKGIYEAMITTAAGLCVAIPSVIGYHWINARVDGLVAEMDKICVDLVERFGQRGVRSAGKGAVHANGAAGPAPAALAEVRPPPVGV